MPALFYAIHALLEFEDMPFEDVKTGGQLHVSALLEVGIEVGGFDVHLIDFKVVLSC